MRPEMTTFAGLRRAIGPPVEGNPQLPWVLSGATMQAMSRCRPRTGRRQVGEATLGEVDAGAREADISRSQLAAALVRVAAGDRAALRMIYQDTSAKLFGGCLRILKERSEAEDVLQDVYLTVWRKAAKFDSGRASPITWMVAIARNRAIDRLRARGAGGRLAPIEAADAVSDPAPAAVERVELAQQQ